MNRTPIICLLAFLSLVGWSLTVHGQTEVVRDVGIGINGLYKLGVWTPVRLTLVAGDESLQGSLRVIVPDGDGQLSSYESGEYSLAAGQQQQVWTYVKIGRADFPLAVEFVEPNGVTHRTTLSSRDVPNAHLSSASIVISVGRDLDIDAALRLRVRPSREQMFHQTVRSANDLPDHLLGYAGVDVMVLVTGDTELLAELNSRQRDAIVSWTRLGGNVIVTASTDQGEWADEGHPFGDLLPGTVESVTRQRQTTGVEQFAGASTPVASLASQIPIAVMTNVDGTVEVVEGLGARRPAIVRGAVGLGRSVFVAFDLSAEPFANWQDRPRLIVKLFDLVLRGKRDNEQLHELDGGKSLALGFDDLVGQLRSALDRFPGVRLIPFSMTASLITVYILLVGPLDYWLLRRWRKPGWTWFTFFTYVIGFTVLAMVMSHYWKGDAIRVNQATIVDIDWQSGTIRGTSWAHVFSPRTEQFQLDTTVETGMESTSDVQRTINWHGLPGEGFGGMSSGVKSTSLLRPFTVQVDVQPADEAHVVLRDYPIAVWSSRSLVSQWWGRARLTTASNLQEGAERQLEGSIPNPLPFDLHDVHLMYDRWAYTLGTVKAGGAIRMEGRSIIDLQTLLTRRRVVDGRNVMTPWDAENSDVDTILRMMMFYEAGKGRSYTNLRHSHQAFIDLSHHLGIRRAILVGRTKQPAVQVTFDGQPIPINSLQNWTYYRLVLPVRAKG